MASTSIGTMSAKITADSTGLKAAAERAKADIQGLKQSTAGSLDFGSMFKTGASMFAGPLFGGLAALKSAEGFKDFFKEMVSDAKQAKRESEELGLSTETYQKLGLSAKKCGEDIGAAASGIGKMQKSIVDAAMKGGEAEEAFKRLGLSSKTLLEMSTEEQLQTVAKAITGIGNSAMRTQAEMEIFGKSGKRLEGMLIDVAGGMQKYNGAVLSSQAIDTFAEVGKNATKNWGILKATIGETIATVLRVNLGFGGVAKTQSEIADIAAKEATSRRQAVDAMQRQAKAAEQLKSIEEGRQSRRAFLDKLDRETRSIMRGQTPEAEEFGKQKQRLQEERDARIQAAEDAARFERQKQRDTLKLQDEVWKNYQSDAPQTNAQIDDYNKQVHQLREMQESMKYTSQIEKERRAAIAEANKSYEQNLKLIDDAGAKVAEARRIEKEGNKALEERKKLQEEAARALEGVRTEQEKIAEAEAKYTQWRDQAVISEEQRQKLVAGIRKTDKAAAEAKAPEALVRGTMEEYNSRVQDKLSAQWRLEGVGGGRNVQEKAVQVAEQQLQQLVEMNAGLARLASNTEGAPTWTGA